MVKVLTPTQIPGLDGLNVVLFIYFLIIIYIFKYDTCAVQCRFCTYIRMRCLSIELDHRARAIA